MLATLADFFAMGGYAFYVWSAYAVTLLVMLANLWLASNNRRRIVARIQHQLRLQSPQPAPRD